MAFCFLQRLSKFLQRLSNFPQRLSAFSRNPRKSIYGKKYTKFCYPSFVFFATRSPSFVIPAKQYLRLTQHIHANEEVNTVDKVTDVNSDQRYDPNLIFVSDTNDDHGETLGVLCVQHNLLYILELSDQERVTCNICVVQQYDSFQI
jgi:hypothetical protein